MIGAWRVSEVRADGVVLSDGELIPSGLVVTPTLRTRDPDIFALCDCASCLREGHSTPVPPRTQAAHQQASHLLARLRRRRAGEPLTPYVYRDFGSLYKMHEYARHGGGKTFLGSLGRRLARGAEPEVKLH